MGFNRAFVASTFLFLLLLGCVTSTARAAEIPPLLWSLHDSGKAAWVSADRAALHGQIDWSLFGELQAMVLRGAIDRNKDAQCVTIGSLRKEVVGSRAANDLKELASNSLAVFSGTVIHRGVGFADGDPATLLQVRIDAPLKTSPEFAVNHPGNLLYIAYPVAEFQIQGLRICKTDETLPAEIPQVGDKVLAFPMTGPLNEDRNMMYVYRQEIFVQKPGGNLGVPQRWRADANLNKATSLGEVESLLKSGLMSTGAASHKEGR